MRQAVMVCYVVEADTLAAAEEKVRSFFGDITFSSDDLPEGTSVVVVETAADNDATGQRVFYTHGENQDYDTWVKEGPGEEK